MRRRTKFAIIAAIGTLAILAAFAVLNEREGWLQWGWGWSKGAFSSHDSEYRRFIKQVNRVKEGMPETEVDTLFARYRISARMDSYGKLTPWQPLTTTPAFCKSYMNTPDPTQGDFLFLVYYDSHDRVSGMGGGPLVK